MADYAEMYKKLFQSQTKAIQILQKAQQDTEEMFMTAPDNNVTVLENKKPDKKSPEKK